MRSFFSRLRGDERGVSALEFALILPIMVMFSAGTIEFGRLILLTQKVQNGAFIVADLTARDKEICQGELDSIFLALNDLLSPFDVATNGQAVVTSLKGDADAQPIVQWQRAGAGTLDAESHLGAVGDIAPLPDVLTIAENETIIVAEVFYAFQPLFGIGAEADTIRKVAYFKPRLGALDTLPACAA